MSYEKAKGRRKNDPHIRIYHWLMPVLMERCTGNEVKVLLYLMSFEKGGNSNGELFMSARMAAEGTGLTKKTALHCLQELDRKGFIRPNGLGYFNIKGGPATKWRLTFVPGLGRAPTNEWRKPPRDEKSWGEKLPATGVKNTPKEAERASTGVEITPGDDGKPPFSPDVLGVESSTQTVASGEGSDNRDLQGDCSPKIAGGPSSEPGDPLRAAIASRYRALGPSKVMQAVGRLGLSADDVGAFVAGILPLSTAKQAALRVALKEAA